MPVFRLLGLLDGSNGRDGRPSILCYTTFDPCECSITQENWTKVLGKIRVFGLFECRDCRVVRIRPGLRRLVFLFKMHSV